MDLNLTDNDCVSICIVPFLHTSQGVGRNFPECGCDYLFSPGYFKCMCEGLRQFVRGGVCVFRRFFFLCVLVGNVALNNACLSTFIVACMFEDEDH